MFTDRWWMQKLPNGWIHMIHDTLDGQGTVSSMENCGIFEVNKSNIRARKTTNVWWQSEVVVQSHRENKTENAISDESDTIVGDSYFSHADIFPYFSVLIVISWCLRLSQGNPRWPSWTTSWSPWRWRTPCPPLFSGVGPLVMIPWSFQSFFGAEFSFFSISFVTKFLFSWVLRPWLHVISEVSI